MIITVVPTIMDGLVVRWYPNEHTSDHVMSASRKGVRVWSFLHEIPDDDLHNAQCVLEQCAQYGPLGAIDLDVRRASERLAERQLPLDVDGPRTSTSARTDRAAKSSPWCRPGAGVAESRDVSVIYVTASKPRLLAGLDVPGKHWRRVPRPAEGHPDWRTADPVGLPGWNCLAVRVRQNLREPGFSVHQHAWRVHLPSGGPV